MEDVTQHIQFDKKLWNKDEHNGPSRPTWCPGCGDFGVLNATKSAVVELQLNPEDTVVVSGIGCSSNFPHFINAYGIHSLHGRATPIGQAVKLSNTDLNVIIAGGDGDGLAIGMGGFMHAARRNMNLTYVIMDNQVYGLTVNQTSPTSTIDRITTSTPYGNIEQPINPVAMAITAGATFVARAFSGEREHFSEVMKKAIQHKGFAFVDAFSPCVTFNKVNTYDFFRERVYKLEETDYQPNDKIQAYTKAQEWGEKIPIGVLYENTSKPTYESMDPTIKEYGSIVKRGAHKLTPEYRQKILADHF